MNIIIGGNYNALILAASIAQRQEVILLEHSELPKMIVEPSSLENSIMGPFTLLQQARAIVHEERIFNLPLKKRVLFKILDPFSAGYLLGDLGIIRARKSFSSVSPAWTEIRTYRDWVWWHLGKGAYDRFHSCYCAKRWGPPGELAAAVASVYHGYNQSKPAYFPTKSTTELISALIDRVKSNGELRLFSPVDKILLEEGKAVGVRLKDGKDLMGKVFFAGPLNQLPDVVELPPAIKIDANSLKTRHLLRISVESSKSIPDVLHLLDPTTPFFKAVSIGTKTMLYASLEHDDPLWTADANELKEEAFKLLSILGAFPHGEIAIERYLNHYPVWRAMYHPALERVRLKAKELSINLIGAKALFTENDLGLELAHLEALMVGAGDEYLKAHIDLKVGAPPKLLNFVT